MIEQIKGKRGGVGLRAVNPERACPGYTLFTPLVGDGTVYLIDLNGEVVHTWLLPYRPGAYGYLTDTGRLFYNGNLGQDPERARLRLGVGGVILEADWKGRVLWEIRHADHHRDALRLRNGNLLLLCMAKVRHEIACCVEGGITGSEADGEMYADYLLEMSPSGEAIWEWRSWEHLDPAIDRITAPNERRVWWTHGNAVGELPDGNIVVSFRSISTVVIVDRASGAIRWRLGPPTLAQQHAPTVLDNGHLLIFDNGTHRVDQSAPFSRVIEVDVSTKQIVWKYQEGRSWDFFSPFISNAQRLPNGNTLICDGDYGRIFEVTEAGEVVWEFVNPHFSVRPEEPDMAPHNAIFRAYRYSEEQIERARNAV